MYCAPFAALSLNLPELKKQFKTLYDRVYYGDVLPPVGSQQISYARMLDLLAQKRIKRITIMADGQVALVEVPVEGWASDYTSQKFDRRNPEVMYVDQRPEWQMEKYRFYVELPGDLWEEGYFMNLVKVNQVIVDREGYMPYEHMLKEGQVTTELVVLDPSDAYVWLSQYSGQFAGIAVLLLLRVLVGAGDWLLKKFGKPKKDKMQEMADEYGMHRAREFNVGKSKRDTGVRFTDVAGIDFIKDDIKETLDMMLGDDRYKQMGARPPRGILLEGPPGTGKTYLAKAMAGEAGLPFYSANGAEFVEMFQGVAAARIRSLFTAARKNSPAIVFIDEIDAIGKKRGSGGGDSGTQERESGLLQMLVEMDGFKRNEQVLVIGATNRVNLLDDALLRPGRFDRVVYMGRPSAPNRLKILQVHAKGKQIPRDNDDALLRQVADLTIGYSGAELANLLNEAAILAVRRSAEQIDLDIVVEAMEKIRLGLPHRPLPDSDAKRRLATIQSGRAVACALTPGMPPIEQVSIQPRGGTVARILFVPMEFGKDGDQYHSLLYSRARVNAVQLSEPISTFDLCCALLVPMYVPRAVEEVLFGPKAVSMSTSREIAKAGELATWLVAYSKLHPLFRDGFMYNKTMGGRRDPTVQGSAVRFAPYIRRMQDHAYRQALELVKARRPVIEAVAEEMYTSSNETVSGARIIELLDSTPLVLEQQAKLRPNSSNGNGNGSTGAASSSGDAADVEDPTPSQPLSDLLANPDVQAVTRMLAGNQDMEALLGADMADVQAAAMAAMAADPETRARLEAMRRFATQEDAPFPPPPPVPEYQGLLLESWVEEADVIEV